MFASKYCRKQPDISLVAIWVALNALDLGLTYTAIKQGAIERNASINWFNVDDTHELVLWKVAFVFACLVFVHYLGGRGYLNPRRTISVASLVMVGICVWNLFVLGVVTVDVT